MYLVGNTGDNWNNGFAFIICIFSVWFLFMLSVPDAKKTKSDKVGFDFQHNVINHSKGFLTRPNAFLILLAITLCNAGEAMLAYVSTPSILDLGFTKQQWTDAIKLFGFVATTLGTFTGGVIV